MSFLEHRIRRVTPRPRDLVHEFAKAEVSVDGHGLTDHQIAHLEAVEGLLGRDVAGFRCRRLEQEPADKREPRPAERSVHDEHKDPETDEEEADATADSGSHPRRPLQIAP